MSRRATAFYGSGVAIAAVVLSVLASPAPALATLTEVIPARIAHAVDGCWRLNPGYRVVFERTEHGLRARHLVDWVHRENVTTVRFSPGPDTFGTTSVGSHHGGSIVFRVAPGGGLDVSFYSRYFRSASPWQSARRCGAPVSSSPRR